MLRVDALCSDRSHPVFARLERWAGFRRAKADIVIVDDKADLRGGDFLFLISCHQIVRTEVRERYRHTLVIHASDLPRGRGWSPMAWDILNGAEDITVSLLSAEDGVDCGPIWQKRRFAVDGSELLSELNERLFEVELELMDWALDNCDSTVPAPQKGEVSAWPKRTPADSEVDPTLPLTESFDIIRMADPERFPAFFAYRGAKYTIRLEKL